MSCDWQRLLFFAHIFKVCKNLQTLLWRIRDLINWPKPISSRKNTQLSIVHKVRHLIRVFLLPLKRTRRQYWVRGNLRAKVRKHGKSRNFQYRFCSSFFASVSQRVGFKRELWNRSICLFTLHLANLYSCIRNNTWLYFLKS